MNWNWNQTIAIVFIIAVLTGIAYVLASAANKHAAPSQNQGICAQDAKLCPDGSYVSRVSPSCDFAVCPVATSTTDGGQGISPYNSGVRGIVSLGPTCPVMRDPPDPECADRPYATNVSVYRRGSTQVFATTKSDAKGAFQFSLPPGNYTLTARGGQVMPTCSPVDVTVAPSGYKTADISCDTGIR